MAMTNIRQRFELAYGSRATVDVDDSNDRYVVTLRFPADEESADEQMNLGFVTGDERIPDSYFYATAYPQPERFTEQPLPF